MARLYALFFNLYSINRDDTAYILDTFHIVREQDENRVSAEANMSAANVKQGGRSPNKHGRYLTKELILAYMNAVAAGNLPPWCGYNISFAIHMHHE